MGGRSSASGLTVTVFGASGHVGRYLVNRLGRIGTQIVVPYRCDEYDIQPMRLMADLGRIQLTRFHLKDYKSIYDCIKFSDVVINLIAQDRRTLNFSIRDVNVSGAAAIARACYEAKTPRLIHMSCSRAAEDAPSEYSRTKAEGQLRTQHEFPNATIVRPSTIFGPQDRLINGIEFTRMILGFPMLGNGRQVKQPIHVSDVTDALLLLIRSNQEISGKVYELFGPKAYTYRRLIELFAHAAVCPTKLISLSPKSFWLYGKIFPEIRRALFPLDTILQLLENEHPRETGDVLGMKDLGFNNLLTVEETMLDIVRKYRRTEDYGTPMIFPESLLTDSTIN